MSLLAKLTFFAEFGYAAFPKLFQEIRYLNFKPLLVKGLIRNSTLGVLVYSLSFDIMFIKCVSNSNSTGISHLFFLNKVSFQTFKNVSLKKLSKGVHKFAWQKLKS